jgi:hypothetical protein
MRIASSPILRIAAGLLLAALLSIVGYQVFRRWISHGPEALLERADDLSWLANWDLVAGSIYLVQARTHLNKSAALIGSVPNNGPNTCASIKTSNRIPNRDLDFAVDRLLDPGSSLAHPCTEHWASQLRITA